jgi:hypothetical protein
MAPVRIRITLRTTVLTMVQNDSTHLTRLGYIPVNHVRPFSLFGWLVQTGCLASFISHGGTCTFEFFISSWKGQLQLTQRQQLRQSISIFRCGLFPDSILAKVIKVFSVKVAVPSIDNRKCYNGIPYSTFHGLPVSAWRESGRAPQ